LNGDFGSSCVAAHLQHPCCIRADVLETKVSYLGSPAMSLLHFAEFKIMHKTRCELELPVLLWLASPMSGDQHHL